MSSVYEIVTEQILKRMEEAEHDGKPFYWVRPWTGGSRLAVSYTTLKPYRGVNQVLLDSGEYITYSALQTLKDKLPKDVAERIQVKPHTSRHQVVFFNVKDVEDEDGEAVGKKKRFIFRYYNVYDIEDITNLKSNFPAVKHDHVTTESMQVLDSYISAYAEAEGLTVDVVEDGGSCFYRPSDHYVRVPDRRGFKSAYLYYDSVLHELIHSTSKGLGRELSGTFGSDTYSKEELIAEIGAQMLLNKFGIVSDIGDEEFNSVAYIHSWSSKLSGDKKLIVSASSKASDAADYFYEVAERRIQLNRAV